MIGKIIAAIEPFLPKEFLKKLLGQSWVSSVTGYVLAFSLLGESASGIWTEFLHLIDLDPSTTFDYETIKVGIDDVVKAFSAATLGRLVNEKKEEETEVDTTSVA